MSREAVLVNVELGARARGWRLALPAVDARRPGHGLAYDLPDDDLVRLAQDGDRAAFEALVRRYADRLYAVVLRFCGDPAEAEDAVQDAFMRAWRSIGRFEARSQFFTWLYRIGLNEAKRRVGRRAREPVAPLGDQEVESLSDDRRTPEGEAERRDVRAALERSVRALDDSYRAPLILRDIEGLSTEQAAAIMGLREAAFKSRLHRARLAVRKSMRAYFGEQAP